jgi:three-Cys-motif partner protein
MSTDPVLWQRDAHTRAKHELLLAFFNKWLSIHSSFFAGRGGGLVRVYDGFAGPGEYTGGEDGSPLILMRALCTNKNLHERWRSVDYDFHFVESDSRRAAALERNLGRFEEEMRTMATGWSDNVSWTVTPGRYEENVPQPVARPSALFLFLDPFGYSQAPMTLTQDLVQQPKSDTLIFLPLSFVHRFAGREGQDSALDRFFGTPKWQDVGDGPDRPAELLSLFEAQLRAAGLKWVASFRLKPDPTNEYYIVGASGHLKGYASIKEGFWAVDPTNGRGYAAPRATIPGQQSLDFPEAGRPAPNTAPLLEGLRDHFGSRTFSVEDAMAYTERSRFLDSHLKQRTLAPAEKRGLLAVSRPVGARGFKEGRGITLRFVHSRPTR